MSRLVEAGALVDWRRAACLCDAGAPDLVMAVCVTAGGGDVLWLVRPSMLSSENDPACGDPGQPHEQIGRLPAHIRDRIWGDALRCGRPRFDGQPCRHRVKEPGQTCRAHAVRTT